MEANIGHLPTKFGYKQMQGWKVICKRHGRTDGGQTDGHNLDPFVSLHLTTSVGSTKKEIAKGHFPKSQKPLTEHLHERQLQPIQNIQRLFIQLNSVVSYGESCNCRTGFVCDAHRALQEASSLCGITK